VGGDPLLRQAAVWGAGRMHVLLALGPSRSAVRCRLHPAYDPHVQPNAAQKDKWDPFKDPRVSLIVSSL